MKRAVIIVTWPIVISDILKQLTRVLSLTIFELHLKIVEHVLKYVTHHMLSTVLKYALRIFELPGPGGTLHMVL